MRMTLPLTVPAPDAATALPRAEPRAAASDSVRVQSVEVRPLAALAELVEPWQALAANALEPNVFYEPAFALAAADVLGRNVSAVLVWSTKRPTTLIGLFPLQVARRRLGVGPKVLHGWTHPYAPLGVPLVDREEAAEAIEGFLDILARGEAGARLALFSMLPAEGAFATALRRALDARGGQSAAFGTHARAMLTRGFDETSALSAKKLKELRRQRRRLGDDVTFATARDPQEVAAALDAYVALEASGWKGAAGTAAARHPAIASFMTRAVTTLAVRRQARIVRLVREDATLAAGIIFESGAQAWFWKIAYDEAEAASSPGVQLTFDLTRALAAEPALGQVDSCATAGHPMIDRIWRDRLAMADVMIAPNAHAPFAFAKRCESAHRALMDAARRLRNRLRGR